MVLGGGDDLGDVSVLFFVLLGIGIFIVGFVLSYIHPISWKRASDILSVLGLLIVVWAYLSGDPLLPVTPVSWEGFLTIFGMFFVYTYKMEHDLRKEFDQRFTNTKQELIDTFRREIDLLRHEIQSGKK